MDTHGIDYAANELAAAQRIVIFTGAGVSAASGVPTFRDADALWEEFPPDTFGSRDGLVQLARSNPRRLAKFVCAVLQPIAEAQPNPTHNAIARLANIRKVTVVTQNIDGLHQDAGSSNVLEIHGTLLKTRFRNGHPHRSLNRKRLRRMVKRLDGIQRGPFVLPRLALAVSGLAGIGLRGIYLPDLVMFGDALPRSVWEQAVAAVEQCDALIQAGTSGSVYPAAELPLMALERGIPLVSVAPDATDGIALQGAAENILPELVMRLDASAQ